MSRTIIKSACIYAQTKLLVQKGHQKVKKCKFTARFSYQIEFWDEKKQQDATELTKTKNPLRTFLQPIFVFEFFQDKTWTPKKNFDLIISTGLSSKTFFGMSWQEILTAKDKLFYSVNVFTAKIILDFYFFRRRPPAPPWLNLFRLVDAGTLFKKSSGTIRTPKIQPGGCGGTI